MACRGLVASSLIFFYAGALAQLVTTEGLSKAPPNLPGTDEPGHFQFNDHASDASPWLGRVGQSAARIVADKHNMGGKTLVNYGPATPACKSGASTSGCP